MTTSGRSILRLLLIPVLLSSALALTACGGSMPSASAGIDLPRLTSDVRKVHPPVTPPDRALNHEETETHWGRDRASLVKCEAGEATVISYYDLLALQLSAAICGSSGPMLRRSTSTTPVSRRPRSGGIVADQNGLLLKMLEQLRDDYARDQEAHARDQEQHELAAPSCTSASTISSSASARWKPRRRSPARLMRRFEPNSMGSIGAFTTTSEPSTRD